MKTNRPVILLGSLLIPLAQTGCHRASCGQTWLVEAPALRANGNSIEPTEANVVQHGFGQPTFIVPLEDGELCVWREFQGKHSHLDKVAKFDKQGRFVPLNQVPEGVKQRLCTCHLR